MFHLLLKTMRRNTILKGYEDSASGSDDEGVVVSGIEPVHGVNRRLKKSTKKTTYVIKPAETGYSKSSDDELGSESDDGVDNCFLKTPGKCKNKTHPTVVVRKTDKRKTKKSYDGYSFTTVFVVDYDMTLVDRNARPFPGAKAFLRELYNFNNGKSTLVLYSHATSNHVEYGMSTYFVEEADFFTERITDHTMSRNKPVTQVRRVLSNLEDLSGPFVIIDDVRSNLDDDQYDITVDVSRHFIRDKSTNKVVDIDYKTVLCLVREGVETWLRTKKKKSN